MRALEEKIGKPSFIIGTGVGGLISTYTCYRGIESAEGFFCEKFDAMVNYLNFNLFRSDEKHLNRTYQFISEFYTLIRSKTQKKKLELSDSKKLVDFLETNFSFIKEEKCSIPSYISLFDIKTAQERLFHASKSEIVKASMTLLPFVEPFYVDSFLCISTQSLQGIPSKNESLFDVKFHVCLDTFPEDDLFSKESALQILLGSDHIRTLELKRRTLEDFDWVINLWDFKESSKTYNLLISEGYKAALNFLD